MTELVRITDLLGVIFRDDPTVGALERACRACVETLPVTGAAISVMTATSEAQIMCASDDTARRLEELQFTLGAGPCVEAYEGGGPVLAGDLTDPATDGSWPTFATRAAEAGVHAVFAFPLHMGAIRLGVLGLYRDRPGELLLPTIREALLAADMICLTLVGLLHKLDPKDGSPPSGLWADHVSLGHAEVHQATGVLMSRLGISAVDALVRLRGYAFTHDLLITEVAAAIVAHRIMLEGD